MRADRLISIIMILQAQKHITATELSSRLEVSVRTIYRDIDNLSHIGIPIVCDRGQGGGIKLLGNYQTTLTGLTADELSYLFMPPMSRLINDLGMEKLKHRAQQKLLSTLSNEQKSVVQDIENYIYIDMDPWKLQKDKASPIITTLQKVVWQSNIITFQYQKPTQVKLVTLKPLSLVLKRSTWYLIGIDKEIIKTYKVSSIKEMIEIGEVFSRPHNFNLQDYWLTSTQTFRNSIPKYNIKIKTNKATYHHMKSRPFIRITHEDIIDQEVILSLEFDADFQAIEFVMGYGKDVLVLKPTELIDHIVGRAQGILQSYK